MRRLVVLLFYLGLVLVSLGAAAFAVTRYRTLARGIETNFPDTPKIFGANVALEQYETDEELERALAQLKSAGLTHARQYFSWRAIEAERGTYDWAKWDRIVDAARADGIQLVAVLNTAPAWSQRAHERAMPNAPPDDFAEYARFVGDFAGRYGDAVEYYQIWDEPNVEPNWGERNADPVEYAQLLIPAAQAVRANDADAKIVLAGLAMNLELHRPHPNYSEILYLRGLYEIGAQNNFDIVAAKPYGMWTGPEDRTVNSGLLNFSRLILLRDEMLHYGDQNKPVWAVEMGWNALPTDWKGIPSPWGTDTAEIQADRLERALERIDAEWDWVTGVFPLYLQPNVAAENPRWGFALLNRDGQPTEFFNTLRRHILSDVTVTDSDAPLPAAPVLPVVLLLGVAVVSAWRAWRSSHALKLDERWRALKTRVNALPEFAQVFAILVAAAGFYFSSSTPLNLVLFGVLIGLFALRLDYGIALTIFVIPFWNFPKRLFGGFELSPVEAFTWIAAAAFLIDAALSGFGARAFAAARKPAFWRTNIQPLDWAALAFLALGLLSTRWAGNFGVASREFRIILLDPILLYALIRLGAYGGAQTRLFVNALLASGVAVCAIGLYQYVTGDVILADGIARLTAVWGSPNNVGLYLGRLLPIALAFALLPHPPAHSDQTWVLPINPRWVYAALVGLFGLTMLLTYSRGALFFGLPVGVIFVLAVLGTQSHHLSRRAWLAIGAAALFGAILSVPFLFSERLRSLFQTGTGTGFFRIAVWTSAVNMIRDHLLLGVGLDNFLYEYPKYILPEAWREPNLSHPHNVLLDFWARLGIGGVLIFVWMLAGLYRRAWTTFVTTNSSYTRALMLGLMASVAAMLAHGLIDSSYFVIDLAYVFLVTLALAQTE